MRGERDFRPAQPVGDGVVRRGKEGRGGGGQPRRLPENVRPLLAVGRRNEMSDQLQVHGLVDRGPNRGLHRGPQGGEIRLVSIKIEASSIDTYGSVGDEIEREFRLQGLAGPSAGGADLLEAARVQCDPRGGVHRIRFATSPSLQELLRISALNV